MIKLYDDKHQDVDVDDEGDDIYIMMKCLYVCTVLLIFF